MSKKDAVESEKSDKSDKSDKSADGKKVFFIQRLMAYMIDILLVAFVGSLIVLPFIDKDALLKLSNSLFEVIEKYNSSEITYDVYMIESIPLSFQLAKKCGIITLITLFLEVLYFIVYQFNSGGQTIGKKIMKIKVISTNGEMTMNQMLIRALIIDSILLDMIVLAFVIFTSQDVYYYGALIFERIQGIILFISIILIMFSKRGRGLHDLISHCEVVKVN